MEKSIDPQEILEHVKSPVFLVQDGIIQNTNHAAAARQIQIGMPVEDIISIGKAEYKEFTCGRLCLSLCVDNVTFHASAVKTDNCDVFYLESEFPEPELKVLALAAQQLREPLADALTSTDALLPKDAQKDPALTHQLQQINRSLYRIHRAICNMTDAAQYSSQRLSRTEVRDVCEVVAEIVDKASQMCSATGRTITFKRPGKAIYCSIDTEKVERALLNMISNAIRYSTSEGPIQTTLVHKGKLCAISICNQGNDLSDHVRANLFSCFLREPGLSDGCNGIGLGMTIVRSTAIAHGGTVLFDQPEPNQVRFTMTLPVYSGSENQVRSPVLFPTDYAGGYDHTLTELSDILPPDLYK